MRSKVQKPRTPNGTGQSRSNRSEINPWQSPHHDGTDARRLLAELQQQPQGGDGAGGMQACDSFASR